MKPVFTLQPTLNIKDVDPRKTNSQKLIKKIEEQNKESAANTKAPTAPRLPPMSPKSKLCEDKQRKLNASCPIIKQKVCSNNGLPQQRLQAASLSSATKIKVKSKYIMTASEKLAKSKVPLKRLIDPSSKSQISNESEDEKASGSGHEQDKKPNIGSPSLVDKGTVEEFDRRQLFCIDLLKMKSVKSLLMSNSFKDPKYKPTVYTKKAWEENPNLNRFNDVFCIDSTRVILKRNILNSLKKPLSINAKKSSDYIHANYVKIPNSDYVYICSQGPLTNTIEDFLLMCWESDSKVVVMLCELMEDDIEKCAKYWPNLKESAMYGNIRVYNEREDSRKYDGITIRTLKIQIGENKKVVIQYQLRTWPDHLVPPSTMIINTLLREVQLISSRTPIVVHCSAGIGRTGTFIGIHYASEMFKNQKNGDISLMDVIKKLRGERLQSVQTTIQFAFLHICLLEYFALDNIIEYTDTVKEFIKKHTANIQEYAKRLLVKRNKKLGVLEKNKVNDQ
uniref:Tyrosine-protein phosphatase domain-containing protein n=1 Tax=Parastrongyloides trichosuri TaxID=131310 RepID=A0A0N5A2I2_PARTI